MRGVGTTGRCRRLLAVAALLLGGCSGNESGDTAGTCDPFPIDCAPAFTLGEMMNAKAGPPPERTPGRGCSNVTGPVALDGTGTRVSALDVFPARGSLDLLPLEGAGTTLGNLEVLGVNADGDVLNLVLFLPTADVTTAADGTITFDSPAPEGLVGGAPCVRVEGKLAGTSGPILRQRVVIQPICAVGEPVAGSFAVTLQRRDGVACDVSGTFQLTREF